MGRRMVKAGTSSSDTECEETQLIFIIVVPVLISIGLAFTKVVAPIIIHLKRKKKLHSMSPPGEKYGNVGNYLYEL